jgi:hypothetical protein
MNPVTAIIRVSLLLAAVSAATFPGLAQSASPPASTPAADSAPLEDGYRLFYNARYEAAASVALSRCTTPPLDLNGCELATSALHFRIKKALESGGHRKTWEACTECPAIMTSFLEVTTKGQAAARAALETTPTDDETRFLLGKLNLNYVWLQLGTLGKKTGLKEYREARNLLDDVVQRNPGMVRARVARAWIDYIVDTRMPFGTKWLLGGGNKKRGLAVVREAADTPADFFVATEAIFALWDMQVRERQLPAAVETARRLARDFPENPELVKFLATNAPEARR